MVQSMNVLELQRVIDATHRIFFVRVDPGDLNQTLKDIFQTLSNLSWLNKIDEEYLRVSFQKRAESTLEMIAQKIEANAPDSISSDAGEYIVSELAREAIVQELHYLDIPLAELYNKKKVGNPGFDFHSQTLDDVIIFGEAKYSSAKNAYGIGLEQIVRFITEEKDLKDIVDLRDFCSSAALTNATQGTKGFAVAFSAKGTPSKILIDHIKSNKDFQALLSYEEIILVAVNV